MLSLKKRKDSPFWQIEGSIRSSTETRRIRESTGCTHKKDAETYLELRLKQIKDDMAGMSDITFEQAAIQYINNKTSVHENDASRIELLNDYFGNMKLSSINGSMFNEFCANELPRRKPDTLNRYRSNLTAILNYTKNNLPHQQIHKIPIKETLKPKPKYLSFDEQEALLSAYNNSIQPLIYTLCFQGCRIGEALRIQWADINLDKRRINIWETKNGDFRSVPMHPRVYSMLRGINRERKGHIFVTQMGQPYVYVHKPNGSPIKTAHGTALKKAGITNFRVHNWRSHWASNMALKGANTYELMALGGWRSSSSVERYVRLNPDGLANAINRLD